MKTFGVILAVSAAAVLLLTSGPIHAQTQDAGSVVHPAPASKTITVTVTETRRAKGQDKEVLIAQAVGFPNDTCDVITTFDVVKRYEERQTWSDVRQQVNIVVDGTAYPAKFRDFGFYPLGLNLACIDFVSPTIRAKLQIPALPLDDDTEAPSLSYDDQEIVNSGPGTPFLNKDGEITSVLVATPFGPLEFASAKDIRLFLSFAAAVPVWPSLRQRSLSSI
ncbi:MAG TPA: hypothetical protein VGL00_10805 [Terracidiphilus sp.]